MKKILLVFLFFLAFNLNSFAQSKLILGIKAGAQYVDPKLYEFDDPYPFYKYDQTTTQFYGSTSAVSGAIIGVYANYPLVKTGRISVNIEINFNRKGYAQEDIIKNFNYSPQPYLIVKKNYLDVPITFKLMLFRNSGLFIETGLNNAFLLSKKTKFPNVDNTSTEFEKRRSRALLRETNLTGFKIGAGWNFRNFDLSGNYQTDKQYEYIQFGFRCPLKTLFGKK